MQRTRILLALLALVALFSMAAPALAQGGGPTDNEVNAVAKNLYCPVCENVPLDVCGTLACQRWRQQIKDLMTEGYTEDEVYDYFVDQYGDRVLAAPPARGLNWLVYVIPPLALLAGGWITYKAVSSRKEDQDQTDAPQTEQDDASMKRIEEELNKRR